MNREELAWAAGFFDGEGTTLLNGPRRRLRQFSMQVAQSEPTTIARFHAALGGIGRVYSPYATQKCPMWAWRATRFEHAQAALAMLWPFLSFPKRTQALAAIAERGGLARTHERLGHPETLLPPFASGFDARRGLGARAASPEQRSAWARKAATARWAKAQATEGKAE